MKKLFSIIVYSLFYFSAYAQSNVSVVYKNPHTPIESTIKAQLEASTSITDVISFINTHFQLPKKLVFVFGAEDGPLYDSYLNTIYIPYNFITQTKNRFLKAKYQESGVSAADATMDSVMHTLFHEFAHAIIFLHELPIVGKEEDAADGLATVLLIEYFEEGQEIALSAADLFNLESYDRETLDEEDFWDEHSLDLQRYYSTLCHIYGSDPEKYSSILEKENYSQDRLDSCIYEYEDLSRNWQSLLKPHFKDNKFN